MTHIIQTTIFMLITQGAECLLMAKKQSGKLIEYDINGLEDFVSNKSFINDKNNKIYNFFININGGDLQMVVKSKEEIIWNKMYLCSKGYWFYTRDNNKTLEVYNDDCINDDKTIHIIEYLTRKSAHLIKKYKNNEKNEELHSIFDDMDALRWPAAKLKLVRKLKR